MPDTDMAATLAALLEPKPEALIDHVWIWGTSVHFSDKGWWSVSRYDKDYLWQPVPFTLDRMALVERVIEERGKHGKYFSPIFQWAQDQERNGAARTREWFLLTAPLEIKMGAAIAALEEKPHA